MKSKIYFTIENTHGSFPITSAMYQKLLRKYRLSKYTIDRLAYKSRNMDKPYPYMIKCAENGWTQNTVEMDYNKQAMEAWIAQVIDKIKPEKKPEKVEKTTNVDSIGDILKGVI